MRLFRKETNKEVATSAKRNETCKDFYTILEEKEKGQAKSCETCPYKQETLGRDFYILISSNIVREYNGDNLDQIAQKYGCSKKDIVKILKDDLEKYDVQ